MKLHRSVLLAESLDYLSVRKNGRYIDATYGAGGHSRAIAELGGKVLALDVNPEAVSSADSHPNIAVVRGNFRDLSTIANSNGFESVDGILFDFGISSDELQEIPGLSFQTEAPLDMRLDPSLGVTASDLLNALPQSKLEELFTTFGEEPSSKRLARAVVNRRQTQPFKTTDQLVSLIRDVKGQETRGIHSATQVFQALRIAVNDELGSIREALPQAVELLKKNGRLVTISFHSGEDRIVKEFLRQSSLKILTKKPLTPTEDEVVANPRSRSAKLRAAEKIG